MRLRFLLSDSLTMTETDPLLSPSLTIPVALINDAIDLKSMVKNRLIVDGMTVIALQSANVYFIQKANKEDDFYMKLTYGLWIASGISFILVCIIAALLYCDYKTIRDSFDQETNRQSRKILVIVNCYLMIPFILIYCCIQCMQMMQM